MTDYIRGNGWAIHLGNAIGGGGEGRIYQIVEEPELVAKIYTTATHEQKAKLAAMLAQPPYRHMRSHSPLAWPTDLLYNWEDDQCVGFLMPYIDHKNNFPLLKLYNPKDRLQTLYDFSWKYLLHAAMNLASTVSILHDNGYIIGDVNESNILISRSALVTLVDCDSIQVPRENGSFFRCAVGKPEYTSPELQGRDFHSLDRKAYHDNFGLAVLIFQMLMEGVHPFSGIWQGTGNPPTLEQNIQAGNSPYLSGSILHPPRRALPFQTLPETIQTLMTRCFGEGHRDPSKRPTAHEWYQELYLAKQQIRSCHSNGQHWYSKHLSSCPWCERMRQGIPDPFPLEAPVTTPKMALRPIIQLPAYPTSPYTTPPYTTPPYHNSPIMPTYTSQVQYQVVRPIKRRPPAHPPDAGAVVVEILLSIIGIFGVGWCIAGKWGLGILLFLCSFLIYWPLVVIPFLNGDGSCAIVIAIGAIVFNAVQLNEKILKGP
jgi:DNA-binding helix-hairpin-helix protein with protein kinase domain